MLSYEDKEKEYQSFLKTENSLFFHMIMCAFATVANVALAIGTNAGSYTTNYSVFACSRLLVLPPLYLNCYAVATCKCPWLKKLPLDQTYVGDFTLIVINIVVGSVLIGMCIHQNDSCAQNRGYFEICGDISAFLIVNYIFALLGPLCVIRSRHLCSVILSFAVQISCIIAAVVTSRYNNSDFAELQSTRQDVVLVLNVVVLEAVVIYGMEKYSRQMFTLFVSSQSHLAEKFRADNEKVLGDMRTDELKHLIGNVAHDLKTPLQAFSYELDCISGKHLQIPDDWNHSLKGDLSESVCLLKSICAFMTMTINRAIDYTKATAGLTLKPSMETLNISEVLEWVVNCMSRSGKNQSVSFEVEPFPPDLCEFVISDKQWLMENLLCLASNARKFTTKGSILIRCSLVKAQDCLKEELKDDGVMAEVQGGSLHKVNPADSDDVILHVFSLDEEATTQFSSLPATPSIAAVASMDYSQASARSRDTTYSYSSGGTRERRREMIMVEVIDHGIGIPDDEKKRLFQPFKQAQRRAGGTGLGLFSLSKRIESLGGSCGVSDRLDMETGSRFWFTFPYRPDTTVALNRDTSRRSLQVSSRSLSSPRQLGLPRDELESTGSPRNILLVDDSELIQKTSVRAFRNAGFDIDVANNGLDCLEKVECGSYQLVLMDMQMPVMDGLEAAKRLRLREGATGDCTGRLVIVGVSANSDNESRQDAMSAGMDGFIAKPLDIRTLRTVLRSLGCGVLDDDDCKSEDYTFNI
jgi:signal transduction histidine kinase/ActR/RegA family two-component response regulator